MSEVTLYVPYSLDRGTALVGGAYMGTSLIRKRPPPYDPPRTMGIGLR